MKKKVSKNKEQVICPCCGQTKKMAECQTFANQLRALSGDYPNKVIDVKGHIIGNYYWHQAKEEDLDWACDACLQAGKAISGEPAKQLFCDFPPHFAYFDQEKVCRVCKEVFIFNKQEQQYWYEHLRFWVQATRVYCKKCQFRKNLQDRISQLLNGFDYQDMEKLKEIVTLYLEVKDYKKARFHLTAGKKQRQKSSPEYVELDKWINEIKELE